MGRKVLMGNFARGFQQKKKAVLDVVTDPSGLAV